MQSNGCYDELAPQLIAHGLRPVPIGPGTKSPQAWHNGVYVDLPEWQTRPPLTSPQPGAGIGLALGERDLVALDLDDDDIAVALLDILPDTPVRKVGRRGETLFYRAPGLASRKFKINKVPVCEILATGTQTVLPPTVHPSTGLPYRWTGTKTVLEADVTDLPLLPDDIVERIENVLTRFGYAPEPERKLNGEASDSPFRALNDLAMKNLPAWVPTLDIYNCKRRRGQHASYEGVATWRPSTSGRAAAGRERNLKISGRGIVDFGDGRKYTPIDLVMAARACTFSEAVAFLDEKLGWSVGGPEFVFDGQNKHEEAEARRPETEDDPTGEHPKQEPPQDETAGSPPPRKLRFKLVPFSELRPGPEPLYLVDELIPVRGLVDVWGKAKCYKSFWTLDVMFHIAKGWEYRDRCVRQGTVIYCAFEGAHGYKKRVEALRRHYGVPDDEQVPLYVMPGQANLIAEHRQLIRELTEQLGGIKPVSVVLDTLNKSLVGSESKDLDMGAYVRAAEAIRDAFDCVVVIVHHCGYDDTHPRGHTSLPGAVDAQLMVVRVGETVTVTVEMMRDGPEDTAVTSVAIVVEVGNDQNGKVLTSLVLTPGEPAEYAAERRKWPVALAAFYRALKDALVSHGGSFQHEVGVLPIHAVNLTAVRDRFWRIYTEPEEDEARREPAIRKAWARGLHEAEKRGLVKSLRTEAGKTMVWVPDRGVD